MCWSLVVHDDSFAHVTYRDRAIKVNITQLQTKQIQAISLLAPTSYVQVIKSTTFVYRFLIH